MRKKVIGIMGGHQASAATVAIAHELGVAIAREGHAVLTGGRDEGVMVAATRAAREAGGLTIAVHPGRREDRTHADADVVIFTGIGWARNHLNILSSDAIIALEGESGTLSEVAYADSYGVPTALLGFDDKGWFGDRVVRVDDVPTAMAWLRNILGPAAPPKSE